MAKGQVGVLVAGVGRMGTFHARTLAGRVPGARVTAVADADGERAAALGAELGAAAFVDMDEALGRGGADAVVVATPSGTHAAWVEAAARAGLPIFCEKPLGTDLASASRALAAVEGAGVPLQLGYQRRFDRGFQALRQEVAEGRLGRVVMVKSSSRDPELSPLSYLRGAGGIFQDQMIHDIDILRYLSGHEIVEAYSAGGAFFEPALEAIGDVDTAALLVRFDDGSLGIADASRRSGYGHDIAAEVFGSAGTAKLDAAKERPITVYGPSGAGWGLPFWFLERFADAYERELMAFVSVVQGEGAPLVTGRDGLMDMLVADAATRSLTSGRPESVAPAAATTGA
jgi:myo-inositol 2-dehydrogenase / D-chiro-inositol 1-dehydrogenase